MNAFGGNREPAHRRMDVKPVADQFRCDFVVRQHSASEAWRPVGHRRHPVEKMRRVPRARVNRGDRLVEVGTRMTERHAMSCADKLGHEREDLLELRRQRDDADIRASRLDDAEDVASAEFPLPPLVVRHPKARQWLGAVDSQD